MQVAFAAPSLEHMSERAQYLPLVPDVAHRLTSRAARRRPY